MSVYGAYIMPAEVEFVTMMVATSDGQLQSGYNITSFSLASTVATTLFLRMRVPR